MNHTYRTDCTKGPFKGEMTEEIVAYHRNLECRSKKPHPTSLQSIHRASLLSVVSLMPTPLLCFWGHQVGSRWGFQS